MSLFEWVVVGLLSLLVLLLIVGLLAVGEVWKLLVAMDEAAAGRNGALGNKVDEVRYALEEVDDAIRGLKTPSSERPMWP